VAKKERECLAIEPHGGIIEAAVQNFSDAPVATLGAAIRCAGGKVHGGGEQPPRSALLIDGGQCNYGN